MYLRWGCKVDAVTRDIVGIQGKYAKQGSTVKCIVFSQWTDVLQKMELALEANGVTAFQMAGNGLRQLTKFKSCIQSAVLLLPLLSRNNGLNIIEATHVFLMEPVLIPSIEAQHAQQSCALHWALQNNKIS